MKNDKMSYESIDDQSQRINSKYFYDIADEIKSDRDYIPFKDLLINNSYDIVDYEDSELLEEKFYLKRNVLGLSSEYKYSQEKTVNQFDNLINEYDLLKEEPLFENDYFPYLELVGIYQREKQFFKGISTILDFFQSEIYCDEIIFEQFRFYMDLFLRRSVLNLTEEQFREYYFNAIKNKNDNGNFLQEDFDRISEYEQFERDLY